MWIVAGILWADPSTMDSENDGFGILLMLAMVGITTVGARIHGRRLAVLLHDFVDEFWGRSPARRAAAGG